MTALLRLAGAAVISISAWLLTFVRVGDGEPIVLEQPTPGGTSEPADGSRSATPTATATAPTFSSPTTSPTVSATPTPSPAPTIEPTVGAPTPTATPTATPPQAPSGLAASATGRTVTLRWNPVAGARYYNVYRSDDGRVYEGIGSSSEPRFVDADLPTGGRVWYIVTSVDARAVQSADSISTSVTIAALTPTP